MIRTLWKTLEYIQNYSRIMIENIKLSKINDSLTFIFRYLLCRGRASNCVNTVNIALFLTDTKFRGRTELDVVSYKTSSLTNSLPFYSSALVTPRINLLGTLLALSLYLFACRDNTFGVIKLI